MYTERVKICILKEICVHYEFEFKEFKGLFIIWNSQNSAQAFNSIDDALKFWLPKLQESDKESDGIYWEDVILFIKNIN